MSPFKFIKRYPAVCAFITFMLAVLPKAICVAKALSKDENCSNDIFGMLVFCLWLTAAIGIGMLLIGVLFWKIVDELCTYHGPDLSEPDYRLRVIPPPPEYLIESPKRTERMSNTSPEGERP